MKSCKDCKQQYIIYYILDERRALRELRCKLHKVPCSIASKVDGYCEKYAGFDPTLWWKIKKFFRLA